MSKDRGMMKWNAFNALLAHGSSVKKMMLERTRIEKPVLSSDQKEDLNLKLQVAIEDNRELEVAFYDKGYFLIIIGGGITGDIQVNDTAYHRPASASASNESAFYF